MAIKDYAALAERAAAEGADMTVAQKGGGGGDYEPPKAGPCVVRLVGYFEIGKQKGTFQGKPTVKEKVQLVFEILGKNYPPIELEDGTKIPVRITIEESLSLNEKARFFKLFNRMNYKGGAKHMVALLGEGYRAKIIHRKYKKRGDPAEEAGWTGIAVELYDKQAGTYTIEPPRREAFDEEGNATGEYVAVPVPPALTEPKAFLWNYSDLDDWNALFIDGEYPERKDDKGNVVAPAKSKNVIQGAIMRATNFKDSPIYALIVAKGGKLDIPTDAELADDGMDDASDTNGGGSGEKLKTREVAVPEGGAADDALNDVIPG